MKRVKGNLWFNIILIFALTLVGLFVALYDSYEIVFESLKALNPVRLVLIVLWGMSPTLIWGYSLTLMAKKIHPSYTYKQGLINAFVGAFMAGITPSSTGGQLAQVNTYKKQGLRSSQGVGIVWMDFYLYTITIVFMTLLLYLLNIQRFQNASITLLFGFGLSVNIFIIVVLSLIVVNRKVSEKITFWGMNLITKWAWIKNKTKAREKWSGSLHRFHDAIMEIQTKKTMIGQLLGLNVLRLLVYYATPFAISRVIGLELFWRDLPHFLALSAFVMTANTFVPLPGASGVTESVFVLAYSTVVGKATAASTMILWRFATFHVVVLIGAVFFLRMRGMKLKDLKTTTIQSVEVEEEINNHEG
ncbi:MAG: flippase-like domain-containing protein [Erysipelotrichaceae bacterium]|nr:flippase-like domain-containing protein [Erysipelotrichaceae bacterium]